MEKKLKNLFDYQSFENSPRLAKLISQAQAAGKRALSDDDVSFLNAAGTANRPEIKSKPKNPDEVIR